MGCGVICILPLDHLIKGRISSYDVENSRNPMSLQNFNGPQIFFASLFLAIFAVIFICRSIVRFVIFIFEISLVDIEKICDVEKTMQSNHINF